MREEQRAGHTSKDQYVSPSISVHHLLYEDGLLGISIKGGHQVLVMVAVVQPIPPVVPVVVPAKQKTLPRLAVANRGATCGKTKNSLTTNVWCYQKYLLKTRTQ